MLHTPSGLRKFSSLGHRLPTSILLLVAGCQGHANTGPTAKAPTASEGDGGKSGYFTSKRFGVRLPFPGGTLWRIDDHSRPELLASRPSFGEVSLQVIPTEEPMSSGKCESLLVERKEPLTLKLRDFEQAPTVLEDQQVYSLRGFETRVRAVVEVGAPQQPFVGHLIAIGGGTRKCFFFAFTAKNSDERELGDRLGHARTDIFDRIEIPEFGVVPKEKR